MNRNSIRLFTFAFIALNSLTSHAQTMEAYNSNRVLSESPKLRLQPIPPDGRMEDIQQSLDGTRLITHDRSFAPKLWDTKTMSLLCTLGSRSGIIKEVFYSVTGKLIITLTETEIKVWDARLAKVKSTYFAPTGTIFSTAAMSADENMVAVGSTNGTVTLLSAMNMSEAKPVKTQTGIVNQIAFSPDNHYMATGADDKTVAIFDTTQFLKPAIKVTAPSAVLWLQFSSDSKQILTTCADRAFENDAYYPGEVRLLSVDGKLLWNRPQFIGRKGGLPTTFAGGAFCLPDLSGMICQDLDGTMRVFDRNNFKEVSVLKAHTAAIRELRISKNGKFAATYGNDEALHIFDIVTGKTQLTEDKLVFMGSPTAGEFSQNGEFWWLGYESGLLQKYRMADGNLDSVTISPALSLTGVRFLSETKIIEVQDVHEGFRNQYLSTYFPIESINESRVVEGHYANAFYNKNGTRGGYYFPTEYKFTNLETMKYGLNLNDTTKEAAFSQDGLKLITTHEGGKIFAWNAITFEAESGREFPVKSSGSYRNLTVNEDGSVVAFTDENDTIVVLNMTTGDFIRPLPLNKSYSKYLALSADASVLVVNDPDNQVAMGIDTTSGKVKWTVPVAYSTEMKQSDGTVTIEKYGVSGKIGLSGDGKTAIIANEYALCVIDLTAGKLKNQQQVKMDSSDEGFVAQLFSPDSSQYLVPNGLEVEIFETKTDKRIMSMQLSDEVTGFQYMPDGKRILVTDRTGGVTIFANEAEVGLKSDVVGLVARRLGNFVVKDDNNWLALDTEGRFDASDPSNVEGAAYVFEWSGGLEPLAVSQFKSQFYEPNLLAKLLGLSKESVREVPALDDLKLFPELKLSVNSKNPKMVSISAIERDGGGIGTLTILLNGKQIFSRKPSGFQQLDLSEFEGFFLPESVLGAGKSNQLSATISNAAGTLSSIPIVLDVETPSSLKTPKVKMYGLFVGVGDYVGDKKDLIAPPKDAIILSETLQKVSSALLPNQVELTTLASGMLDPASRPSKKNILDWFKRISEKSTSSDIVIIFMAGHGTSEIGALKDYFFLTADIDPMILDAMAASGGAISGEELRKLLSSIPASKQVVILDTCHSGAAAESLLGSDRSVSADFARAYESIRDSSGTWMLAGSAADQLSYESPNVEHGLLSYSLLEAIDKEAPSAFREGTDGKQFLDVERWLTYAASRVESLKNEVGLKGVQKPEFKRSKSSQTFDIGLTTEKDRGMVGLRPPMPIVIVGAFAMNEEDPAGLEPLIDTSLRLCTKIKPWFEVAKHPNVYRVAGSYEMEGDSIQLKLIIQKFDAEQQRKTVKTIDLIGTKQDIKALVQKVRETLEKEILVLESATSK